MLGAERKQALGQQVKESESKELKALLPRGRGPPGVKGRGEPGAWRLDRDQLLGRGWGGAC